MKSLLPVIPALCLLACASTPQGKLHQGAKAQKLTVDSVGNTYLDICKQVVRPRCEAENEAFKTTSSPWTREDRIACLRPCDSETAALIQVELDAVIAGQLIVLGLLKSGETGEARLESAQAELRESSERLLHVLQETGVLDFVEQKLLGG